MEQKMGAHFLKWWAQAYQTNHSLHLGSDILYLHFDTDTCMHICTLTADDTVKPFLSGHWKKKLLSLNAGQKYCRMLQGEHSAILLTFIKLSLLLRSLFFVFFEWLLKTCFTVLTTYMYFLFCRCKMNIFIEVRFFHNKKKMGSLGPLPWKVMGHILKSWDNDPGPP